MVCPAVARRRAARWERGRIVPETIGQRRLSEYPSEGRLHSEAVGCKVSVGPEVHSGNSGYEDIPHSFGGVPCTDRPRR